MAVWSPWRMTALSHGFSASCQFAGRRNAQKSAHELSGCRECHSSVEHVMHFFASVPMGAMRRKWLTCVSVMMIVLLTALF